MYISDFKPGQKVLYIPDHALGKPDHPDIERGVVEKVTRDTVRIRIRKELRSCDPRWLEVER